MGRPGYGPGLSKSLKAKKKRIRVESYDVVGQKVVKSKRWHSVSRPSESSSNASQRRGNLLDTPSSSATENISEELAGVINLELNATDADHESLESVVTNHYKKKQARWDRWSDIKESLIDAWIEELAPASLYCVRPNCGRECADIIHCKTCGPHAYYCEECATDLHSSMMMHDLQIWNHEFKVYVPYELKHIYFRPDGHRCASLRPIFLRVVDINGSLTGVNLHVCDCESTCATLLRYRLWSATPNRPQMAFTLDFMKVARALILECQVPLSSFCTGLKKAEFFFLNIHKSFFDLDWENMMIFMWVAYSVETLKTVTPDLPNADVCFACPQDGESEGRIYSLDGNMRMVHLKKRTTLFSRQTLHEELFFLNQSAVDETVQAHSSTTPKNQNCSTFQADGLIRAKNKTGLLDATGMFASVCRHDSPKRAFDLKHGERMGYSIHMINYLPKSDCILYDIACLLDRYSTGHGVDLDVKLGIPVFHSYAHKYLCQMKYSPRRLLGAGLTDGEGTERLWSYVVKFATITKGMDHPNRKDLLEEVLLNYSNKVHNNLWSNLRNKWHRAVAIRSSCEKELETTQQTFGITLVTIQQWITDEDHKLQNTNVRSSRIGVSRDWREMYGVTLLQFYMISDRLNITDEEMVDESARLEVILLKVEKTQTITRWLRDSDELNEFAKSGSEHQLKEALLRIYNSVTEYKLSQQMVKRYARGVKTSSRLCKQLSTASKRLWQAIHDYNSVWKPPFTQFPKTVERRQVLENTDLWEDHLRCEGQDDSIPMAVKRRAIDVYHLINRSKEEQEACRRSVSNIFSRLQAFKEKLFESRDQGLDDTRPSYGRNVLIHHKLFALFQWAKNCKMLENCDPFLFSSCEINISNFIDELNTLKPVPSEMDESDQLSQPSAQELDDDLIDVLDEIEE